MGCREAEVILEAHLKQSGIGKCLRDLCKGTSWYISEQACGREKIALVESVL